MKWTKAAVIAVIAIFSVSYVYSSIKRMQLSTEIETAEMNACNNKGGSDCDLIANYHDDCFEPSYRAEYRIRTFHAREYRVCMDTKLDRHRNGQNK